MILGTRGSPLARAQSGWVRDRLLKLSPGLDVSLAIIRTAGDAPGRQSDVDTGMAEDGVGIFVRELEAALHDGRIDLAVHSLKDLPTTQPEGLTIAAVPSRNDPRDLLVTREGLDLSGLPEGASVGTGSPRRAAQILASRPGLRIVPMRGNVDTRIRLMMEGRCDALVLAAAGLSRLGYAPGAGPHGARTSLLDPGSFLPAPGQGALALEVRSGDTAVEASVAPLHDAAAGAEVTAERAFLEGVGGGCRAPVAALGAHHEGRLRLTGLVALPDGSRLVRVEGDGDPGEAAALGRRLAGEAMERGAGALLAAARR